MRGLRGNKIELEVIRENSPETLNFTIIRDIIRIKSVKARLEGNDDVGYLRITSFSGQTYVNLKEQIKKLFDKTDNKLKGFVLDLRNNPGGLLDQAVDVSDAFLEGGEIVSTKGRNISIASRKNATTGDLVKGLPVVVLINGGSASASEIVAGALQDHKRAIIMGTKSFGKGSVQTVMPVSSSGAMKLTTARYYTPSGKSIQGEGIKPDIEVKQAKIDYGIKKSSTTEADLRGSIKNDQQADDEPSGKSAKNGKNKDKRWR